MECKIYVIHKKTVKNKSNKDTITYSNNNNINNYREKPDFWPDSKQH